MTHSTRNISIFKMFMWCIVILIVGGFSALVWKYQNSLLFHPRTYSFAQYGLKDIQRYQHIGYQAGGVEQTAFYLLPRELDSPPRRIWIMFNGNASLALDWHTLISAYPDDRTAFFLIDYPGYGKNEGLPSKKSIYQATDAAFRSLIRYLGEELDEIRPRLGVVGYSLGSAPALELASKEQINRVVLISPFSTMQRLVCTKLIAPFCYLLRHRFDNISALQALLKGSAISQVVVLHGTEDTIIPATMSQTLAGIDQQRVHLALLEGEDHNSVFRKHREIINAMVAQSSVIAKTVEPNLLAQNPTTGPQSNEALSQQ